jgi:hypothetical protein
VEIIRDAMPFGVQAIVQVILIIFHSNIKRFTLLRDYLPFGVRSNTIFQKMQTIGTFLLQCVLTHNTKIENLSFSIAKYKKVK